MGIDTISADSGDTGKTFNMPTHRTLLSNGIWIIENVNERLSELPARGFSVAALPYKIGGGSGAPTRLVAYQGNWMSSVSAGVGPRGSGLAVLAMVLAVMKLFG